MVTYKQLLRTTNGKDQIEATCLSSDTKPTANVANGSILIEMDTSKMYFFDEAHSAWKEWA